MDPPPILDDWDGGKYEDYEVVLMDKTVWESIWKRGHL